MNQSQIVTDIVDELYEQAHQCYNHSEACELRRQRFERMDSDCHDLFTQDEQVFVRNCFAMLLEDCGARERFIYECGMRDSVVVLKHLGVL